MSEKYRVPDDRENEILRRNGIDPEGLAVNYADDNCIRVLRFRTRDEIVIHRGDKKWS